MKEPLRILVVDDEIAICKVFESVLSGPGIIVTSSQNGHEALQLAESLQPDLILLDLMMPGLDGFDVCRRIRLSTTVGEVPIMIISGMSDRASMLEGLKAGADDFLPKTLNPVEMTARVKTALRLNRYRRLADERMKFKDLVDLAPDGIMVVDETLTIRSVNRAMCAMLELPDGGSPQAGSFMTRFPERQAGKVETALKELRTHATPVSNLGSVVRGERGTLTPVEISARLVNWDGAPSTLLIVRDVRDKKSVEAQLMRAQRMQTLGNLAGGIAHDLNNVLTPVSMAMGILQGKVTDPLSLRAIDTVLRSVDRGADLIGQVLTFARGDEQPPGVVSIRDAARELERILTETLPPQINLLVEAKDVSTHATFTQVHQILMNLCVNARDAMANGGMLVLRASEVVLDKPEASQFTGGAPGTWICLEVKDSGHGMAPEVLSRIGDPFFTTKAMGKGTGLGLRTAFQIVKDLGGFVGVESQVGKGSTFRVFLPPAAMAAKVESRPTTTLPSGDGQTILICDDDAAVREMLASMLECFGYRVEQAADGMEAVSAFSLARGKIDCVITDVVMPFVDGFCVAETIHKTSPGVPVMLMTGSDSPEVPQGAASRKLRLIRKPFTTEVLLNELGDALRGNA